MMVLYTRIQSEIVLLLMGGDITGSVEYPLGKGGSGGCPPEQLLQIQPIKHVFMRSGRKDYCT